MFIIFNFLLVLCEFCIMHPSPSHICPLPFQYPPEPTQTEEQPPQTKQNIENISPWKLGYVAGCLTIYHSVYIFLFANVYYNWVTGLVQGIWLLRHHWLPVRTLPSHHWHWLFIRTRPSHPAAACVMEILQHWETGLVLSHVPTIHRWMS